ncbi:hypothetical protein AAG747_05475 [Rapidithrix thailandica]|uniref:Uncharacterized protein n=1 Tax=Rapidithrix thailandica TaxID=413964 RepID=A0AAW9S8W1_9BACT
MAIFDIFSKRQKRLRGDIPEVFTYNEIPETLRVKIVHIIEDAFGIDKYRDGFANTAYEFIQNILCREYGEFRLSDRSKDYQSEVINFLLEATETDKVLDVIELSFKYLDIDIRNDYQRYSHYTNPKINPDDAIIELNERFKEEGIGYSFEGGEIIRIDSTYMHSQVTKPTISLLWNKTFLGANEEYLKAHEHYKHGRNKKCLTDCLKAFESTMKIICTEKGWAFTKNDTSRKLIQICFQNGLVPSFTQNQFTSLQNLLESGIPTIRNKLGGGTDRDKYPKKLMMK